MPAAGKYTLSALLCHNLPSLIGFMKDLHLLHDAIGARLEFPPCIVKSLHGFCPKCSQPGKKMVLPARSKQCDLFREVSLGLENK